MARFCHFWHMTPDQFWALDADEYAALARYRNEYIDRQNQQQNRG